MRRTTVTVALLLLVCVAPVRAGVQSSAYVVGADLDTSRFAARVISAGDIDLDGYSDLLVATPDFNAPGLLDAGRVQLFRGTSTGPSNTPAWTITGTFAGEHLGEVIAAAGDVNGDGYADVMIGAPAESSGAGRVRLYLGSPAGISATPQVLAIGEANAQFGFAIAGIGDLDRDGFDDVLIAAPFHAGASGPGAVYVFRGNALGVSPTPSWTREASTVDQSFGTRVSAAGDANGDGYADFVVLHTVSGAQSLDLYRGGAGGPDLVPGQTVPFSDFANAFPLVFAAIGDVDCDGYADLAVGELEAPNTLADPRAPGPTRTTTHGDSWVYVEYGSSSGYSRNTALAGHPFDSFGASVGPAGDVNGDGLADLAVGSPDANSGAGRVLVYEGSTNGLRTTPVFDLTLSQAGLQLGSQVGTAGDLDGDGFGDLLANEPGCPRVGNPGGLPAGAAFIWRGLADLPNTTPDLTIAGKFAGEVLYGVIGALGDINGDGYGDVGLAVANPDPAVPGAHPQLVYGAARGLVTATDFLGAGDPNGGSEYLARVGDVNGDGYDDLLDVTYRTSQSHTLQGRAELFDGSPVGPLPTGWVVYGGRDSAQLGTETFTGGDVNGDGYADILLSEAWTTNTHIGRATLYMGGPSGPSTTPAWSVQGDSLGDFLSYASAFVGDVNRDGYGDVVIAVPRAQSQLAPSRVGEIRLYLGGPGGLSPSPSEVIHSTIAGSSFGIGVDAAGDVDGDGYADVLVEEATHGLSTPTCAAPGESYLFRGGPSGLITTPAWTYVDAQTNFYPCGLNYVPQRAVGVGDVNRDGYDDVLIGEPEYVRVAKHANQIQDGRAVLLLGGPGSLSLSPVWIAPPPQDSTFFGLSAGAAGDMNGDGFPDLLVGADYADLPDKPDVGKVYFFFGNGGVGCPRDVRVSTTPGGNPGLRAQGPRSFIVHANSDLASGRSRARLEVEAKPLAQAFDGNGLLRSAWIAPSNTGSDTSAQVTVSGLTPGTPYHWRARLATSNPTHPHSAWMQATGDALPQSHTFLVPASNGTGVANEPALHPSLQGPFPNPVRGSAFFGVEVARRGTVSLTLHDIAGRKVATLLSGVRDPGRITVRWEAHADDGSALRPGIYYARLRTDLTLETRQIVVLR